MQKSKDDGQHKHISMTSLHNAITRESTINKIIDHYIKTIILKERQIIMIVARYIAFSPPFVLVALTLTGSTKNYHNGKI